MLIVLFLAAQSFAQYCSAADLELSIATRRLYDGDADKMTYVKPPGNKISVYQRPLPFYLVVENTSNSSQKLWEGGQRNGKSYFSIEFENDKGQKTIIDKKKTQSMTSLRTYDMIRPGEQRVKKVLIDPDQWDGFQKAEDKIGSNFKVRAIYKNENKTIYSPWYEVMIGPPVPSAFEKKEKYKPKVLSSREQ